MSSASVRFSSSSRSMRSMNERSRSPAIPPTSGIRIPLPGQINNLVPAEAGTRGGRSAASLGSRFRGMKVFVNSVLRLRGREGGLLLGRRLLLVLRAPFVVGHAIDDLARLRVGQRDALLLGRLAVPTRKAVAAEAGEVHQVDVLHIGALAQMCDERAERRGFEFGAGLVVHAHLHVRGLM